MRPFCVRWRHQNYYCGWEVSSIRQTHIHTYTLTLVQSSLFVCLLLYVISMIFLLGRVEITNDKEGWNVKNMFTWMQESIQLYTKACNNFIKYNKETK